MNKYLLFQLPKETLFLTMFFFAGYLNTATIAYSAEKSYGNFRVSKVVVKDLLESQSVRSENLLSWDSKGNISSEKLTVFKPGSGNSRQSLFTTKVHYMVNKKNQLIKREVNTQGLGFSSQAVKDYYYGKSLIKTVEVVDNKNLPNNTIVRQYVYDGERRLKNVDVKISTDNVSNVSEKHDLTYDQKGRVVLNNITRQFQSGELMQETHQHQYDENGHLIQTIISKQDIQETRTYLPQKDSMQLVKTVLVNVKTGEEINRSIIQHFFDEGRCLLVRSTDARSLESSIDSVPYSPSFSCINK